MSPDTDDLDLWQDIVKMFYDHETAGHPGELETYNSVKQYYWWPGMQTFVKCYVQGCGICQQFKINRNLSHPSYMPIEGAKSLRPCQGTSLAVCTPLYTLFIIHILHSFYFAYIHLLLFGYHLNLSCSQ